MRVVLCLVLAGCTGPELHAPSPVMIGSTISGNVSYETCQPSPDDGDSCSTTIVPIASARFADAQVFALADVNAERFTYTALAPGITTLTVVADGDTYDGTAEAALPNKVEASLSCGTLDGPDVEIVARFKLYHDNRWMFHDDTTNPLTSSFLLPVPRDATDKFGEVRFRTPSTPGTGTITSPFDPAVALEVTVVDETALRSYGKLIPSHRRFGAPKTYPLAQVVL